jgi:hypothetical protein
MPPVWDLTTVNDELDLLEFRLRYLDEVVDRFVVVEAPRTFAGATKPLHVTERLERFAPWAHKLDVVVAVLDEDAETPWVREGQQREEMYERAATAPPRTLLVSSDIDEVPFADTVRALSRTLERPTYLQMRHQLYYANWLLEPDWVHGFAARVEDLAATRRALDDPTTTLLGLQVDAGNHYSFLGGEAAIGAKFRAYSHQEFNTDRDNDPRHLQRCLRQRVHFSGARILTVTPRARWDDQQTALFAYRPSFFDESPAPRPWASRSYAAWVWLRRRAFLPDRVIAWADGHERALMPLLRAPMAVLYLLLLVARRATR